MKMAVIAGAAQAPLKYKAKKPRATEQEIIQHVTDNTKEIIDNIDEDVRAS